MPRFNSFEFGYIMSDHSALSVLEATMLLARDIMTTPIISVGPEATVAEVAELLLLHGVSAVPVAEGDRLLGIVSEGDLLHREEIETLPHRRSWWLRLFDENGEQAREYVKTHSRHAKDVMTR